MGDGITSSRRIRTRKKGKKTARDELNSHTCKKYNYENTKRRTEDGWNA